jgi:hypothetical protein
MFTTLIPILIVITHTPMAITVLGLGVRATGGMVDGVIMVLGARVTGHTVERVIMGLGVRVTVGMEGIADSFRTKKN